MTSDERDRDERGRDMEALLRQARALYHEPPATPREEMWRAVAAGLASARDGAGPGPAAAPAPSGTIDLSEARRRRRTGVARPAWLAAAAAALLVLGIGIGRSSLPEQTGAGAPAPAVAEGPAPAGEAEPLGYAAREHLDRTESLLMLVRADARDGRIDPAVSEWARGLLVQTRLLMDARAGDPDVRRLLEDLELVLVQIAGVGRAGAAGEERTSTELELAIEGLEEAEVLPRLHAVAPLWLAGP